MVRPLPPGVRAPGRVWEAFGSLRSAVAVAGESAPDESISE